MKLFLLVFIQEPSQKEITPGTGVGGGREADNMNMMLIGIKIHEIFKIFSRYVFLTTCFGSIFFVAN